jgi:hypothetical protein
MKLNQVIAIEKGIKAKAQQELTQAHHGLQKPELLAGLSRSYEPKDAEGDKLPSEETKVQIRAEELVQQTGKMLAELFDITATKDATNCEAFGDVVVGETKLLEKVPVSSLLFLEKQLVDIHTFVKKLPVLDAAFDWEYDRAKDCMKTKPVQSQRTKKVLKAFQKSPATDKHPAQVETFNEDVVEGHWTTTRLSGALEQKRVKTLLSRVEELQKAVKIARENANMHDAVQKNVGDTVFSFLFSK